MLETVEWLRSVNGVTLLVCWVILFGSFGCMILATKRADMTALALLVIAAFGVGVASAAWFVELPA